VDVSDDWMLYSPETDDSKKTPEVTENWMLFTPPSHGRHTVSKNHSTPTDESTVPLPSSINIIIKDISIFDAYIILF
jgi:hypothetical protein